MVDISRMTWIGYFAMKPRRFRLLNMCVANSALVSGDFEAALFHFKICL